MNTPKPHSIALVNALIITSIATGLYALFALLFHNNDFKPLMFFAPVVFLSSYFVIKYSINRFIYEKIKIIYRTIGSLKTQSENKPSGQSDTGDVLEIVNQAVLEWSEEQKEEIEELKKLAAYRREFIGNVSHELKTPIFNIQGYVLTLLDGGLEDDKINVKFLKRAKKSVNRLIAIVEDLEDITRFETGELTLKLSTFNLNELIHDVMDYMDLKAQENNVVLHTETSPNKAFNVVADMKRIRQVLINLIDNAIKYGDEEKGKVNISVFDFHDYFLVEVSDNGMGIPEEFLFRVFERFYRTDAARARQKGGSGLGLAIVRHIIEAHQQKISVRNNPDRGSTFSFSIKKA